MKLVHACLGAGNVRKVVLTTVEELVEACLAVGNIKKAVSPL